MVILIIFTTMLIVGWVNLQRASAFALRTNQARATSRDAIEPCLSRECASSTAHRTSRRHGVSDAH